MPIVVTILLGMSSISLSTLSSPTTSWSSFTPKYMTAPCAFAKPQIHSRYLSCQLLLYSTFWLSLAFILFAIVYYLSNVPKQNLRTIAFFAPVVILQSPTPSDTPQSLCRHKIQNNHKTTKETALKIRAPSDSEKNYFLMSVCNVYNQAIGQAEFRQSFTDESCEEFEKFGITFHNNFTCQAENDIINDQMGTVVLFLIAYRKRV